MLTNKNDTKLEDEIMTEEKPKFLISYYQDGRELQCYCNKWLVEPLGEFFLVTCSDIYFEDVQAIGFPQANLRTVRQLRGFEEDTKKAIHHFQQKMEQVKEESTPNNDGIYG